MTVAKLTGARGGWHYVSAQDYCSRSCNSCQEACGVEADPTDDCGASNSANSAADASTTSGRRSTARHQSTAAALAPSKITGALP